MKSKAFEGSGLAKRDHTFTCEKRGSFLGKACTIDEIVVTGSNMIDSASVRINNEQYIARKQALYNQKCESGLQLLHWVVRRKELLRSR